MNPEVGIVFHFIKEREVGSQDHASPFGENSHENPSATHDFYRYGTYFRSAFRRSNAIASVLQNFPLSLQWIRGIDVCNHELSMPTWLFVPLFQHVFEASKQASTFLREALEIEVPAIRKTAHVGEDFAHLLTGLRRVDETLEFLSISEGDRLGHALALGTDPHQWAKESGPVAMNKITRLFDLVWEWSVLDGISTNGLSNRIHFVEAKILELIDDLFSHWEHEGSFGADREVARARSTSSVPEQPSSSRFFSLDRIPEIHEIANLRLDAANPEKLKAVGFPNAKPSEVFYRLGSRREKILLGYLTDQHLIKRGRDIELVDPTGTADTLQTLQDGLRRKVGARGIVVEVNPTSNLLISKFNDLRNHPLWRLDSPNYEDSIPPVSLGIGSDDPLVFATDLRQEYQRLVDALLKAGYSDRQATRWINEVRNNGLESRFTLPQVVLRDIRSLSNSTIRPVHRF